MTVTGLCQLCEGAPAAHQCARCGALVCSTHYVEERGLCTECVTD